MTLMPTFLAGANWVMHSAGWLEGGLVAGYEKFIVDVELLQMLQASSRRWRSTRGRWPSTRTRRSATAATSSARCTRWSGSALLLPADAVVVGQLRAVDAATAAKDAAARATEIYQQKLEEYEQPPLDDAIRAGAGGVRRPPPRRAGRLNLMTFATTEDAPLASSPSGDFVLVLTCPDRPGAVHAVSGFLVEARRQHRREPAVRRHADRQLLHADRLPGARHRSRPGRGRRAACRLRRGRRPVRHALRDLGRASAVPDA